MAGTAAAVPRRPSVLFNKSPEAIEHNTRLLEKFDFDLERLLESNQGTTLSHGSEFGPVGSLALFLSDHPLFPYMSKVFTRGMDYSFHTELSEEARVAELEAQIRRGNHKSAQDERDTVVELLMKEVQHGFAIPIDGSVVPRMKGEMVQPCGVVTQMSLEEDGSRTEKKRLTHDLSFSALVEGASVNDRVDKEQYPPMLYGWCLARVLHFVVHLRCRFPSRRIFIAKSDYSDAYRRLSHAGRAAASTIILFDGVAHVCVGLAFGGSPNPACFCSFSETLTDLANDLAESPHCTPNLGVSPTVKPEHLVPREYEVEGAPFGVGIPPAFEERTSATSRKDCFIDDIVNVFLDDGQGNLKEGHVVPLAIQAMSRPLASAEEEPLPRRPLLAPKKMAAEGRPSEVQVVLGWELDTRKLQVALPVDKFRAWSEDIERIIRDGKASKEVLATAVGRLNHASYLIPLSRHFLSDLREKSAFRRDRKQVARLSRSELGDLSLWVTFLEQARREISMNLLTERTPTHLAWSDSCPVGLGGYTLGGRAWRFKIPSDAPFLDVTKQTMFSSSWEWRCQSFYYWTKRRTTVSRVCSR